MQLLKHSACSSIMGWKMNSGIIILFLLCCSEASMFSEDNFVVSFDPHILPIKADGSPHVYDENELTHLLKLVSKRFRRLSGMPIQEMGVNKNKSAHLLPEAVAKINLLNESNSRQTGFLELLMNIDLSANMSTNKARFELGLLLAVKANSLVPGTVVILQIQTFSTSPASDVQLIKQLRETMAIRTSIQNQYKLAYTTPLEMCELPQESLERDLTPILHFVDILSFSAPPGDSDLTNSSSNSFFISLSHRMSACKARLQASFSKLKIQFETWSHSENSKQEDGMDDDLVSFWKLINLYTVIHNTTVVIHEAFDTSYHDTPEKRQRGWWKVDSKNGGHNVIDDCILEEKSVFIRKSSGTLPKCDTSLDLILTTVILIIGLLMPFVIICARVIHSRSRSARQRLLENEETQQFLYGNSSSCEVGEYELVGQRITEIPLSKVEIDNSRILGTGTSAIVYRATIPGYLKHSQVAAKVTKDRKDLSAFKRMMQELKLLKSLGTHTNVVELIGVNLEKIKAGKLYIFFELCEGGSLLDCLRRMQSQHVEEFQDFTRPRMLRWSHGIACGMEFLASKRIIHSDVAARNILLTSDDTPKIIDFGLSHQLSYDYLMYTMSSQQPLPWRWLPPESLRRCDFSEKSDVWAFGVTLWEIYSLGDTPYPGLSWDVEFCDRLENGLRLPKPKHDDKDMYSLMLNCWEKDPSDRLTFSGIVFQLAQRMGPGQVPNYGRQFSMSELCFP